MFDVKQLIKRARLANKTVVLPEAEYSERVMSAAIKINKDKIAKIIIVGDEASLLQKYGEKALAGITIVNPKTSDVVPSLINTLVELRKDKGMTKDEAEKLLANDYIYFATMLVKAGYAHSLVAGAETSTANTMRPALQIIKAKNKGEIVSSCFLVTGKNKMFKEEGCMFLADCAINQKPNAEQIAQIAYQTVQTAKILAKTTPRVAFLSYSTLGSATSEEVLQTREAAKIFKEKYPHILSDGELQLDTAIVPDVANRKAKGSPVAGNANILIFPNLEAGNICYKAIAAFSGCYAIGPIMQGFASPVNDLSRSCSVDEVILLCAVSCLQ